MPNQLNLPIDPDTNSADAVRDAEREEYLARLREYLKDPAFRAIEGFPIGEDEDILALSDPPWYTACPNPFLPEIVAEWRKERDEIREELGLATGEDEVYHREPYASDVSEGKNNPIYNAHSYHTKVPHKAIMRYILHYTDPGDVVLDGFCGTGMTGVAAQLCGDKAAVQDLGYRVDDDGVIWDGVERFSRLGARKAVLNDLSPAATFIAYNYNTPVDANAFEREAKRILREVEKECGWMYETWHPHCDDPNRVKAHIDYTVWSDVFVCPECGEEFTLWDVAVDPETRKVSKQFACPQCTANLAKSDVSHAQETVYSAGQGATVQRAKRVPVLICYSIASSRLEKRPDQTDHDVIARSQAEPNPFWFAVARIDRDIDLWFERDYRSLGIYSIDGFFTSRNLYTVSCLWAQARAISDVRLRDQIMCWLESVTMGFTLLNRYLKNAYSQVNRILSGTLYVGSLTAEVSPRYALAGKIARMRTMASGAVNRGAILSTCSTDALQQPDDSLDYVFVDPPFGSNIIYSDLSIVWESWLRLATRPDSEAVVHRRKKNGHTLRDYQQKMTDSFAQLHRLLRPGRWMTVEFHNTRNSVWNAIQEAMVRAGFVVADVRTMDKGMGTFKQVTAGGAVKQDLIISAYKPTDEAERTFQTQAGTPDGAWAFVRQHLAQVPVVAQEGGILESIAERQDYLLYDRMVAYHLTRNATVPLSASQFYAGLRERFVQRDGMFFLPDQVTEYDRARMAGAEVQQLSLFVNDEKSAIQWLRRRLDPDAGGSPQTYQDIQPAFLQELHQASHEALPELRDLLEQNFVLDERGRYHVPDAAKAGDIEQLRKRALLREFDEYAAGKGRLRQFRSEAVRAGFAACHASREWQKLIHVARRLPSQVLEEDPDLLMYYDSATLMVD
ncbi:MAG: DNA methyltransferase [Anaerolineae bacterium]